jgi:hypothetical protein
LRKAFGFVKPVTFSIAGSRADDASGRDNSDSFELAYAGSLNALDGVPFPFSFDANASRATGDFDGFLGSRSEFENESRGGAVNWKSRAFPTTLRYSERLQESTFRSGADLPTETRRDDVLRQLRLRGASSKLSLSAERDWFDDRIGGRDNDYTENRGQLTHFLTWGKGSRLDTLALYTDRQGLNENQRIRVSERARLQHSEDLYSTLRYGFESFEQETDSITHDANYGLTHQLYENLTTNLDLSTRFLNSDVEEEENYRGGLDFDYRKRIFWGGHLNAGLGGSYGLTDRTAKDGVQSVVDEAQVIGSTGSATLDQRFIDPASIVVTDATGTIVFTEGVDYEVFQVGNDLTEIRIILGGQINFGDTVLVSYRFEILPDQKFSSREFQYNLGLNFGWIRLFHQQSMFKEDLIKGRDDDLLIDSEDMTTGLELRWDGPATRATALAARRFTVDRGDETESFQFQQRLFHRFSPRTNLNVVASEVFSDESDPERDVALYTAGASLQLGPWQRLLLTATLDGLFRKETGDFLDDGAREEKFLRGALDLSWSWRKLFLKLRYSHLVRRGDTTNRDEDQVFLRVSRRF